MSTAVPTMPLDEATLQGLASELAREVHPLGEVLQHWSIASGFFEEHIREHPRFRMFYAEAYVLWNTPGNYADRSRIKSGVAFEEWVLKAGQTLHDDTQPLSARVELGKFLARISGIEQQKEGKSAQGEKFVLNINFSGGLQQVQGELPKMIDVTPSGKPQWAE